MQFAKVLPLYVEYRYKCQVDVAAVCRRPEW